MARLADKAVMEPNPDPRPVPPAVSVDLRAAADRRAFWRGGRRNSDWFNRPIGAWRNLEQRLSPWREWVASWPLHHLREDRPQGQ